MCPTCDHTLGRLCIHERMCFDLCDRCGTVTVTILDANPGPDNPRVYVPKLVERCRQYEIECLFSTRGNWDRVGIRESIHTPANRP